ncbi:MAG: thioredoxin domain-containing protein [Fidelibacterota bacterium]
MNHLADESSPYLQQHADNPVDWYPWGEEAFLKAQELDRPIFLSIGYSTCHWCHVMEHESFENEQVADLLNGNFVAIKVDREERQEIDHLYLSVCQAMTGSSGWPLTIIMTPEKKPFFAGTYFPRENRFGRPGLLELLPSIIDTWKNRRQNLLHSASQVQTFLEQNNTKTLGAPLPESIFKTTYNQLHSRFDNRFGGFGTQPKFPSPHNLLFLLRYYRMTGEKTVLVMVEKTLQEMRFGGVFDQLGFGFHRYSTDQQWLVPHFEKMLYDQAMLTLAYTEAYQITSNELYRRSAEEILSYVLRDMTSTEGGFYSAEDADSEGEEGKFYLWTIPEINRILTDEEAKLIIQIFNLQNQGNFQATETNSSEQNILHLNNKSRQWIEAENTISENDKTVFQTAREKLFNARETRIHPFKDDKILTDWNGLMIAALAKASIAFNSLEYRQAAEKSADFILRTMLKKNKRLYRRFRNGSVGIDASLDDYAFIIWGLLNLYEATFDLKYLKTACDLTETMSAEFWDKENSGFFLGSDQSDKLLVRAKSGYDGAYPSGNSVATLDILRLGKITGKPKWNEMAEESFRLYSEEIQQSPIGFTLLTVAYLFSRDNPKEIVIVGNQSTASTQTAINKIRSIYYPNKIILFKNLETDSDELAELAPWTETQMSIDNKPTFYVCKNFACNQPTTNVSTAIKLVQE